MMGYGGYGYNMMGGWSGMMIMPIILLGVFIFLFYNKDHNNAKESVTSDNSLNILKERFALGEINEEEYINKKNMLLNYKI